MKTILTALGNPVLNNELKRYSKYDVISDDLFYQEAVLDIIKVKNIDTLIISGLLQGQYDLLNFMKEIRKLQKKSRIILIVDEIKEEEKNILISKGIFDILYDQEVEISDVIFAIDREEPILLKNNNDEKKEIIENIVQLPSIKEITKTQKQEVIMSFGSPGSGKSTILFNLVKEFSKKTKARILLIDFDTLSGNLEQLVGVNKVAENVEIYLDEDKKCGINYAADLIAKNRFDINVLEELVINCGDFDFLSGNTSLHYCQNVLNESFYEKLLNSVKQKYDFIFLDGSSNIFLDSTKWALEKSTKVLFITENTNIALKKTLQLLDCIFGLWGLWKGKVQIILNRIKSNGLEKEIFEELTSLKVIGEIPENSETDTNYYESILETIDFIPKKNIFEKINFEKEKILKKIKEKKDNNFKNISYENKQIKGV